MNIAEAIRYFESLSSTTKFMLAVFILFFLIVFRDIIKAHFWDLVLVAAGKKKIDEISFKSQNRNISGVLRTKVVYRFPANCMVDTKTFFKDLAERVQKHREYGEAIVFDLTECNYCNAPFRTALIDLLRSMIEKNNVLCNIIFPKKDVFSNVSAWLDQEMERTGSKSIRKWVDRYEEEK